MQAASVPISDSLSSLPPSSAWWMYGVSAGSLAARRRAKKEEQRDEAQQTTHSNPANATSTTATATDAGPSTSSSPSAAPSSSSPAFSSPPVKTTPALLRIQKDLADLDLPEDVELRVLDAMSLSLTITATSGYWKGGVFEFIFHFPDKCTSSTAPHILTTSPPHHTHHHTTLLSHRHLQQRLSPSLSCSLPLYWPPCSLLHCPQVPVHWAQGDVRG